MDQLEKAQTLEALNRKAEELAIGLRELAADLAAQADNFSAINAPGPEQIYCNYLQNAAYDILLRSKLVEQAARVFLGVRTLKYKPLPAIAADTKDAQV